MVKSMTNSRSSHISPLCKWGYCPPMNCWKGTNILAIIHSFYDIYAPHDLMVQRAQTAYRPCYPKHLQENTSRYQTALDYAEKCMIIFISLLTHLRYCVDYVALSRSGYGCLVQGK